MKYLEPYFCWLLALALSLTNMANGWMWITYASVSDFTAQYYHITLSQVNWISLLYAVIMTIGVVPFIWFIDHLGVKITLTIAAVLNLVCSVFHCVSSSLVLSSNSRYVILIIGSILGGLAQPLSLFSSTKLAATWFSASKRVSANTLAAMGNPLGVLLSTLVSPMIVTDQSNIPTLNLVNLIPATVGLIIVLIAVFLAPKRLNNSLCIQNISFLDQMKICFRNVQFWIIVVCLGMMLSIFTTISTLIQQILCPLGYSDMFSGICGALFLAMGLPGVLIVGPIVTRIGAMTEVVKCGMVLTTIGLIVFSIVSNMANYHVLVALSVSWMGVFGFGVYPSSLELAAETAHPAGEVISTGVLISISQMLSVLFIMAAQATAVPIRSGATISVCSVKDVRSYWISMTTLSIIGVINGLVFMCAFYTKYKRVISEHEWSVGEEMIIPLVDEDK